MLQLNDLTIGYRDKTVAKHLTAHLDKGRLTCLIGRNGTGKSTLMRTIAGFQPSLSGSITISLNAATNIGASHSPSASTFSPSANISLGEGQGKGLPSRDRAKLISVVLTKRPNLPNMTVYEMAAMGRSPYTGFWGSNSANDDAIVNNALDLVGMSAFADRRMSTLSDGEAQKVMIAKALAQQTPLILLDEPTAFLDYPSKKEILIMLQRLCHEEGKTVLLSTHDLDVAMRLTDNVWLMVGDSAESTKDGTLLAGTPQSLSDAIHQFMN